MGELMARLAIGELEANVMEIVKSWWMVDAGDVHGTLGEQRELPYSTVMTIVTSRHGIPPDAAVADRSTAWQVVRRQQVVDLFTFLVERAGQRPSWRSTPARCRS